MTLSCKSQGAWYSRSLPEYSCFYLYMRFKLGKFHDAGPDKKYPPLLIHLNEDHSPEWVNSQEATRCEAELLHRGFALLKAYGNVDDIFALFDRLHKSLSQDLRATLIGALDHPLLCR